MELFQEFLCELFICTWAPAFGHAGGSRSRGSSTGIGTASLTGSMETALTPGFGSMGSTTGTT